MAQIEWRKETRNRFDKYIDEMHRRRDFIKESEKKKQIKKIMEYAMGDDIELDKDVETYPEFCKRTGIDISLPDPVNHPPHYTAHPSGVECIQIAEHMNFCIGNAVKYLWRAELKGDVIEDLQKAVWYISREIKRREDAALRLKEMYDDNSK